MNLRFLFVLLSGFIAVISCEKDIDIKLDSPVDQIVVEGYIENGLPPYVFLSRNSPYFGDFDVNDLSKYFVSGARITVFNHKDTVELMEYSSALINLLPEEERLELSKFFQIPLDSNFQLPDITVYTVPIESGFVGEFNEYYNLRIEVEGKVLTATTTIPEPVSFSKLWVEAHPNPKYDSLVMLYGRVKDPDTLGNFYQYATRRNSSFYTKNFQSVLDDLLANGQEFDIMIPYGVERFTDEDFDFNTFGYWHKEDTCYVKLSCIDRAHYEFRRSMEDELGNQGSPFGSFTRVRTNISGGLGVWGGYGSTINVYYPK